MCYYRSRYYIMPYSIDIKRFGAFCIKVIGRYYCNGKSVLNGLYEALNGILMILYSADIQYYA